MNAISKSIGSFWQTQVAGDGESDFGKKAKGVSIAGVIGAGSGAGLGFVGGLISESKTQPVNVPNPDYVGPNANRLIPVEGERGGVGGPDAYLQIDGTTGQVKILPQGSLDWMRPGQFAPRVTELGKYSESSSQFSGGYGHVIARPDGSVEYVPSETIGKARLPEIQTTETHIRSWANVGKWTLAGAGIGCALGVIAKVLHSIISSK